MGQLTPSGGTVRLGSRVKVAYYDQEHRQLNPNHKIIDEIVYQYDVTLNQARDWLAQVLFFGEDVEKRIGDLSGGEKARVALLKIILDEPNLLIMDEPTNHLDISAKEIVEQFLEQFPAQCLWFPMTAICWTQFVPEPLYWKIRNLPLIWGIIAITGKNGPSWSEWPGKKKKNWQHSRSNSQKTIK